MSDDRLVAFMRLAAGSVPLPEWPVGLINAFDRFERDMADISTLIKANCADDEMELALRKAVGWSRYWAVHYPNHEGRLEWARLAEQQANELCRDDAVEGIA